jgi:hypothetical protein
MNMNFLTTSLFASSASGFMNKVSIGSSYLNFKNSSLRIIKVNGSIATFELALYSSISCTKSCAITYFYFNNKYPQNLYLENDASAIYLTFDIKASYMSNSFIYSLNSDVTYTYPSKISLYTITNYFSMAKAYYSNWAAGTALKLYKSAIDFYKVSINNALKQSISGNSQQIPLNYSMGSLYMDTTILFNPLISNSTMISVQYNGTIYSDNVTTSPTSTGQLPTYDINTNNINKYQFIIGTSLLQNQIDILFALNYISFADSFEFTDITIYNIQCTAPTSPKMTVIQNVAYLRFNFTCQVYTDVLSNFTLAFNALANISFSKDLNYYGNSLLINIGSGSVTNYDINGDPTYSYTAFTNHFDDIINTMKLALAMEIPPIYLPTLFQYIIQFPKYIVKSNYIVYGE